VHVSRIIHCTEEFFLDCMVPEGFTWVVTFSSDFHPGDQYQGTTTLISRSVTEVSTAFCCLDIAALILLVVTFLFFFDGDTIANVNTE
jgi:hypothetical protein